jgi:hypothetical protein
MCGQANAASCLVMPPGAVVGIGAAGGLDVVSARTLVIAAVAAVAGGVLGRGSQGDGTGAALLLLAGLLIPALALGRWGQQSEAAVWLVAAVFGAILGTWGRVQRAASSGARSSRASRLPAPTPAQRRQAGGDLVWMLLFLAGLLLPVLVGLVAASLDAPTSWRLVAALGALAATDVPLLLAGTSGRGPQGVLQPWRWSGYLLWLAIRLAIVLPAALLPFDG